MTPLQTLIVDRIAELDLSFRRAAAKSEGLVSPATLNAIAVGRRPGMPNESTMKGIALALDLPVSKVREAVGLSDGAVTEFKLPKSANHLTQPERKAVLSIINAFLKGRGQGELVNPADEDV